MAIVNIRLPHHHYSIIIEPNALNRLGEIVHQQAPHARCALMTDRTVGDLHGGRAGKALGSADYHVMVHAIEPGEQHKNLDTVRGMYDAMLDAKLERKSPVVALGGGVLGDMAGFAAATYLRGVPFIPCPTTLLAMVDASVGGKVGVNVPQGKNLVGAFYQPRVVVMDPLTLSTLAEREVRCGLAECVKHAVIRDASLFQWMDEHLGAIRELDEQTMVKLLERNVSIKAAVVMEDEKEAGVRAHLNFGHTFAHAIEATSGYGELHHGEAVGLGMLAATRMAIDAGLCEAGLFDPLRKLLDRIGLPVTAKLAPTEQLVAAMAHDKKVAGDRIRFVLPTEMGEVTIVDDLSNDQAAKAIEVIREG